MEILIVKIIASTILSMFGAIAISNVSGIKFNFNIKNIILLTLSAVITSILFNMQYQFFTPIISCLYMTYFYKYIFNVEIKKAFFLTIVMMIIAMLSEIINSLIFINFASITELRNEPIWIFSINISVGIFTIIISKIKILKNKIESLNKVIMKNNYNVSIVFVFLILTILSIMMIFIAINFNFNYKYVITILLMVSIFVIGCIYIKEKVNNDNLNKQYDVLLECIQTFENWIEKEQLNLHESKNQLAVLKCMVKNKKAVDYLNEIIKDKIVIENTWINALKSIPSGGLKGLIYYKLSQAKIKNISVEINIESTVDKYLKRLSASLTKEVCRIIGIYFDNAIEACEMISKKNIGLEIYLYGEDVIILISNYIKQKVDPEVLNQKGYSTKGAGRGNGLFFVSKIIEFNKDKLSESTEITNDCYIKKLVIKTKNHTNNKLKPKKELEQ